MADFADEVRRFMAERGLSLRGLARAAGYDPSHLSKILSGRKPASPFLAARLDDALGAEGRIREAVTSAPPRGSARQAAAFPDDINRRELLYLFSAAGALMAALGVTDWERLNYFAGRTVELARRHGSRFLRPAPARAKPGATASAHRTPNTAG